MPDPHDYLSVRQDCHVVSLVGDVTSASGRQLLDDLAASPRDCPLVVEVSTPGGDAEIARLIVQDIDRLRQCRPALRFLGKTQVFSAGVTLMSAFPPEDRYLTRDTILLIHGRQLDKTVEISGPMRASIAKVDALKAQLELGVRLEEDNFARLIQGSSIAMDDLIQRALHNWYLTADEALSLGLVGGLV